ncbi:CHASE2 domain-containing protein [Treponema sp.]|uniref:CHASE2 domain-containing protein n=1 Tax=Treponema sp. TaxID=166 RepID=UPI002A8408FC|nr:CHASE2 domain-containing protein [Treponema sp.]MCI6443210.1 CHASE2 domain-containing protein [Spirochaetia bacterium]MDY4132132.1 CHASE2 domain-containing protein [Treponema sp.]
MKSKAKSKRKNTSFSKFTGFIVLIIFTAIAVILAKFNMFQKLDYRLYDYTLGLSKEIETNEDIVLIDIDDESLGRIGAWPWTRDIIGNSLLRMKEFGARQAIFDIEYLSSSTKGINENLEETVLETFAKGEEDIANSVLDFAGSIESGNTNKANAQAKASSLMSNQIDGILYEMQRDITSDFSRDYDDYFARCIQFFGNASLTVNFRNLAIKREPEEISYAHNRFLFSNVEDPMNLIQTGNVYTTKEEDETVERSFTPAMHRFVSRGSGLGFTNVVVDKDGIRRRVELLNYHDDRYAGQLAFGPLLKIMDVQKMERTKNSLIVYGAKVPGKEERQDIKIPLDKHGRMLINWLHGNYYESFRHVPVYMLYNLDIAERLIIDNLAAINEANLSSLSEDDADYLLNTNYFYSEYKNLVKNKNQLLLKCRGFAEDGTPIRGGLTSSDYSMYFFARKDFFKNLKEFTDSLNTIQNAVSVPLIAELVSSVDHYLKDEEILRSAIKNSVCFIGNCATSSTDLGVTPFIKRYANLGTHANVANTILQQDFITEIDVLWGIAVCFCLILVILLLTINMSPSWKNVFGIIYIIVPAAMFVILMIVFKIYIPAVVPFVMCAMIFITEVTINFRTVNADKKFLQSTFGAYVAPAVVNEIIKNPDTAKLGGENKNITALFSDVKTFSGFTEVINDEEGEGNGATRLVSILNEYLGALSDAIMSCHGTIDKYVGDEIVSFFGAPIDDPENAYHACLAGIRMLQAEAKYNEENKSKLPIIKETGEPFYLHSRVGINTGNMVVGNMGTSKKLNYTIMGNNVNLASRLEGTNKVYNSWIICSDTTWQAADSGIHKGELIARKLDYVRVVNVNKPVQIHNILGLKSEMDPAQVEAAALFNEGMRYYLMGSDTPEVKKNVEELKTAYAYFKKAKECYPADGSSEVFLKRCSMYIKKGVPAIWDGVYTMTSK